MNKKLKERIGIDRTVISNIRLVSISKEKLSANDNVEVYYDASQRRLHWLEDGTGVSYLKIIDNNYFGTFFAGTKVSTNENFNKPFTRMDITINDEDSRNLQNRSMEEYQEYIADIFDYMEKRYGIKVDYSNIELKTLELNATFYIPQPFTDYHRVLRLMMFNMPDSYKKLSQVSNKEKSIGKINSETFESVNKSMKVKIYDKKEQLQNYSISTDSYFMRIEIVLLKGQKIKDSLKTNKVFELTDEDINNYYFKQFEKLFEKRYRKWQIKNQKLLREKISYYRLKKKIWQHDFFQYCSNEEQKNQLPFLLDIEDGKKALKYLDNNSHASRAKKTFETYVLDKRSVYFNKDAEKAEFIIDKVHTLYNFSKKRR